MPISQDQITTLDQLEEKLTLALTDLLLLRDSNNEDYKVKASTILQAAVDKAGAELIGGNVESGNTKAVTGNEVANIMSSLPNDSVLHYSFDEIPDIPDGTATERYLNGNTYDVSVSSVGTITTDAFTDDNKIHKSNVNGNANYKSDVSQTLTRGIYFSNTSGTGLIKIIEFDAKTSNLDVHILYRKNESDSRTIIYPLGNTISIGKHKIVVFVPQDCFEYSIVFYAYASDLSYTEWELTGYYLGDGSYVTPIIDNVNGQNNGVNNGGIAVQGVSGKGACFHSSLQSVTVNGLPAVTSNDSFSINLWLNISEMYVPDTNSSKAIFAIGNLTHLIGLCRQGYNVLFVARADASDTSTSERVSMDLGNWHCYTMVYNGQTHNFNYYVDGVKRVKTNSNSNPAGYQFGNSDKWTIWGNYVRQGASADSTQQPAEMDDILFYDRALTDSEVMALYLNKANTPKYYNRADWKLEQIEAAAEE